MFIISNGAYKSGSTWLYLILEELLKIKNINFNRDVVEEWRKESNPNFLFSDETVPEAIARYAKKDDYYLSKVHLLEESSYETIKENSKNIKILFIKRNIGDAIVSHYHHFKTETGISVSFPIYYWLIGRFKALEIESFTKKRKKYFPNALEIKFEDLKSDFYNQVEKVAEYLGFDIKKEEIDVIKKNTDLNNLKDKAKKGQITQYSSDKKKAAKHFRKGKVGEAENILSNREKRDLARIKEGNVTSFFELYYHFFFKFRRSIYKM
jgi:hypothetical protein